MGFRRCGCCVVGALFTAARCVEGGARELARHLRLACDEAERGGVDRRVVATSARMDCPIAIAGAQRLRAPAVEWRVEGEILGDARGERRDVLFPLRRREQSVAKEPLLGLSRGARAREREHCAVLEPELVGMLCETLLREVECRQQLASPLCAPDGLEPLAGRSRHVSVSRTGDARSRKKTRFPRARSTAARPWRTCGRRHPSRRSRSTSCR